MTAINITYAREKLGAIARSPESLRAAVRTDAYWRIASEADLFSGLSTDGSLTPQQYAAVEQHIQQAGVSL